MPAVIVAITGFLVSKGFELIDSIDPVIVRAIFIFATAFAVCLTVALEQNLRIQKKHSLEMLSMNNSTVSFCFMRIGSFFLPGLCVVLCVCMFFLSIKFLTEPIEYWKASEL